MNRHLHPAVDPGEKETAVHEKGVALSLGGLGDGVGEGCSIPGPDFYLGVFPGAVEEISLHAQRRDRTLVTLGLEDLRTAAGGLLASLAASATSATPASTSATATSAPSTAKSSSTASPSATTAEASRAST